MKPNIASTCVARSLLVWLNQLDHIQNKTPRKTLVSSLPTLKKAAAFLANASTDAFKLSAKSAALANSARRALWIKTWSGDIGSKNRLCSIPCEGDFLFGSVLDDLLEKADENIFSEVRQTRIGSGDKKEIGSEVPRSLEGSCSPSLQGLSVGLDLNDNELAVGGRLQQFFPAWEKILNRAGF